MKNSHTLVIGGGAAGITAAIGARRKGVPVVICERMPKVGKKVLASGNGRCNLSNENLDESGYNRSARNLVKSVFTRYGKEEILNFFKDLGLETYSEGGRVFPATNQSSSVLKVLEMELARLGIVTELNFEVDKISHSAGIFSVKSKSGKSMECGKLIIAGGGKSYPALGSDGSCYELAHRLGHKIIEPVPAAVPLVVKDKLCHLLQGQKIFAKVKAVIDGKDVCESRGDLLFTKYGLSGTSIIDVSEEISVAINRHKKNNVFISIDMVPFMDAGVLENEIAKRVERALPAEELIVGILPNKFGPALKEHLDKDDTEDIAMSLKNRLFKVLGTRGWNEAEFTSGGVDTKEVNELTLESKLVKNLYFAGEALDVCGKRGGYNLAWAWASGLTAGEAAFS
ncbi:MAG: aminoacetone oxidase family FAD-binding enzyme [Candidatus Omnitrophota bacterium]|nr:aminoacetone oxidase family FAD-binding enzyme [Candidatus Omnitrophota bacterium]